MKRLVIAAISVLALTGCGSSQPIGYCTKPTPSYSGQPDNWSEGGYCTYRNGGWYPPTSTKRKATPAPAPTPKATAKVPAAPKPAAPRPAAPKPAPRHK